MAVILAIASNSPQTLMEQAIERLARKIVSRFSQDKGYSDFEPFVAGVNSYFWRAPRNWML